MIDRNGSGSINEDLEIDLAKAMQSFGETKDTNRLRQCCESVLRRSPNDVEALRMLAGLHTKEFDWAAALDCRLRLTVPLPNNAENINAIGDIYRQLRDYPKAYEYYQKARQLEPDNALYLHNIGLLMRGVGRVEDALVWFASAQKLKPDFVDAIISHAAALYSIGRFEAAAQALRRAIELQPDSATSYVGLANCALELGRYQDALDAIRLGTQRLPDDVMVHVSHAFLSNYLPDVDDAETFALHQACAGKVRTPGTPIAPHANNPSRDRPLRVGYVSGTFNQHPVGCFLEQVLLNHDRAMFEPHAYSMTKRIDALTARLRAQTQSWHEVEAMQSAQLAERIRRDGIDILVDLSGYENWKQLEVFALKPAPVQVSWLGYWNTTGLETMDYFITDWESSPPGHSQRFTEQLIRLPQTRFCYTPPAHAPEVAPPPAASRGYLTFGSFNKIAKLNDRVIALWSKVLTEIPNSRLLLKGKALSNPATRDWFVSRFEEQGIAADRLMLRDFSRDHRQMLEEYADMDIALDPFPFSGALTTCEALWMGVPTVSMGGRTLVSRQTVALLKAVGLDQYCADDAMSFVATAVRASENLPALLTARAGLRAKMKSSALCNGASFTRDLEAAFRGMWHAWCGGVGRQIQG